MAFIDNVLQVPSYKWAHEDGNLVKPSLKQLWGEAFTRTNIFKSKKNWIPFINWAIAVAMLPFLYLFLFHYFSWPLVGVAIVYAMVIMSTHGTIWFHRYSTHRAYSFSNPVWRFITQNLVLRTFPEEVYVVSHHVHHLKSDKPGDPYNSNAGIMYCMLSDVNHQAIAKNLSESDYKKVSNFISHTGVVINSYKQYQKWGSVANPFYTVALLIANWTFWFTVLTLIAGPGLPCALFSGALFWYVLVRAFNYTGHGGGQNKHVEGVDFDRSNMSINQMRPGLFSGEWHNNHHMYPDSARAGFLKHQLDLAWVFIYCSYRVGIVNKYNDSKKDFLNRIAVETKSSVETR